jgi:hypothetical protein
MSDLSIIQKTYDLIKWYVPILNKLCRDHKLLLGNRKITELYNILDNLIMAQYAKKKLGYFSYVRRGSNLAITSSINSEGAVSIKLALLA